VIRTNVEVLLFAENPRVNFRLNPDLIPLFSLSATPGSGRGTPEAYEEPDYVSTDVIADIAGWIQSERR